VGPDGSLHSYHQNRAPMRRLYFSEPCKERLGALFANCKSCAVIPVIGGANRRQRRARAAHLSRAGEGGRVYRRNVRAEPRRSGGYRARADLADQIRAKSSGHPPASGIFPVPTARRRGFASAISGDRACTRMRANIASWNGARDGVNGDAAHPGLGRLSLSQSGKGSGVA
jgi:hypothetical protein